MKKKLIAALACRNQGSRLFGKPIQNLDVENGIKIIDNIINCLKTIECIDEIVLGIAVGTENEIFIKIAKEHNVKYIIGDEDDVVSRLISCGDLTNATDIFRMTSECPFLFFDPIEKLWEEHCKEKLDATFYEYTVDGTNFEIMSMSSLKLTHQNGENRHRSEHCSLYIRENLNNFAVKKIINPPKELIRMDLRLTVDNPEDLVVCRILYNEFKHLAPRIPVKELIKFLDENEHLKKLIYPFTEIGYSTMYR